MHVLHETHDGDDVRRCAAHHSLCLSPDSQDLLGNAVDSDDAWLVDDNAANNTVAMPHFPRPEGQSLEQRDSDWQGGKYSGIPSAARSSDQRMLTPSQKKSACGPRLSVLLIFGGG